MFKMCLFATFCLLLISFTGHAQNPTQQVLLEEFTNTYCPNCIIRHPAFAENILAPYEDNGLFHIAYHVSYPISDDVFYQANPSDIAVREAYYGVQGTPTLYAMGELAPYSDQIISQTALSSHLNQTNPIQLLLTENTVGNSRQLSVRLTTVGIKPEGAFQLRVMVVEKTASYSPPYAGMEAHLRNVFRRALPSAHGTLCFAPPTGVSTTYNFTYSLDPVWNADEIYTIAFVQNDTDKSILNTGSSWGNIDVPPVPTATDEQGGEPMQGLYPNPFSNTLQMVKHTPADWLYVYDGLGRLVVKQSMALEQVVNVAHLPIGIYHALFYTANEPQPIFTQRLIKK